jgi:O-antigen/teichoic acid export membrane protein
VEPDQPTTGDLRSLVIRGLGWKVASQVSLQVIAFATTLILVRLLTPTDFGLAAMALVFVSLAFLIVDLGLSSALVQRPTLTEDDRSTAFWTNAALGLVLTGLGILLAGPLSILYRQEQVKPLFAVLSFTFLFTALGSTQGALLIRDLRFRSLELRTVISTAAGAATAIVLAILGFGAWAIIAQSLANSGVSTLLLWRSSPWRPRFVYSAKSLRGLIGFSGFVFGSSLLFYVSANADNFLIGRYLGAAALGVYAIAYNVMLIPMTRLAAPIQQVFFPAFSRIREPVRIGAIWLRISRLIGAITVPAFLGMIVVAPDFVPVVLGEKWVDAIPVLQILACAGVVYSVRWQTSNVLLALDRASALFRFAAISSLLTVAAFAVGVHWGIVAVAAAFAIVTSMLSPYYISLAGRLVGVSVLQFVRSLSGVALAAFVMAATIFGLRLVLLEHLSTGLRLAALVVVGAAVYVPLCAWLVPELANELRGLRGLRSRPAEIEAGD